MHGIIFTELRKFVDANFGSSAWNQLLHSAGLGSKLYLPVQHYPDADAMALVAAASEVTGQSPDQILEQFGEFIAPSLLGMYRTLVDPEWRTLDLLEHTENTIHTVVRQRNPGAHPAQLKCVRTSPTTADLIYSSHRKMCSVAKGIVRGMARHYGEDIVIEETACMHDGAEDCRLVVTVTEAAGTPELVGAGGGKGQAPASA